LQESIFDLFVPHLPAMPTHRTSSIGSAKIARAIVNLVSSRDAHNGSAKVVAG